MKFWLGKILRDERGAAAIEYGLIAALVVLGMIGALTTLGSATTGTWNNVSNEVSENS